MHSVSFHGVGFSDFDHPRMMYGIACDKDSRWRIPVVLGLGKHRESSLDYAKTDDDDR